MIAPTPRDTIAREGASRLIRFRPKRVGGPVVLLVPSMINRWYVLDLRKGASLVAALLDAGLDVYCLDWGRSGDEDRFLTWDDVVAKVGRAVRRTKRHAAVDRIGLLGYCMGATLAAIHTALEPDAIAAFVNLAGPIDFRHAGCLGHLVDRRWFDVRAIASAGNVTPSQMQAGFVALRPTGSLAKLVGFWDRAHDPAAREAFYALETWANDNVPFPAAAYVRYIEDLYQNNALIAGEHHVAGRRVDLGAIRCPLRIVVASDDAICPAPAAVALRDRASSRDADVLTIPGGHVGAVVGRRAATQLYPALAEWFQEKRCNSID